MPQERFFVEKLSEATPTVELTGLEHHHLVHVMRAAVGDAVTLVDGCGGMAAAVVALVGRRSATLAVEGYHHRRRPSFERIVIQAIARMNRMEMVVEKGTELGMTQLWLFPGSYSERKTVTPAQLKRLKNISVAALKQCGRRHLPEIIPKPPLEGWLAGEGRYPLFFGDLTPTAPSLLSAWSQKRCDQGVMIVIGPESGLSEEEQSRLKGVGAQGVKLHKNILRTDTAPLAALSIVEQLLL